MKTLKNSLYIILATITLSCNSSFLERVPQGELSTPQIQNPDGVESVLIGAYALLNGNRDGTWGNYASAPSQWLFGDVAADNAHKGSTSGDQATMSAIEGYAPNPDNEHLGVMWTRYYEGVSRANRTLSLLAAVQGGSGDKVSATRATEIEAEAKMLRAHYYFYLVRLFKNIPYVDETLSASEAVKVANDKDVYPMIEADLKFAADNLPVAKPKGEVGRVDKIAAKAYLGKVYLYLKKYQEANTLFEEVIAAKPALTTLSFTDNFDITKENGPESIFAVQHSINPDGGGHNANVGDMLSGFYGTAPVSCCGFFQPSIDLASAFQVGADGLPLSTTAYRAKPVKSDFGLTGSAFDNFTPDKTQKLDPRIDYTLGRRGVPFRDWGVMPGNAWIRDVGYGGPFVAYKHTIELAQFSGNTQPGEPYVTGLNVNIIRLADVYLMAAETAVETGNLSRALQLVNAVRERAAKLPAKAVNGSPVADYTVKPYAAFANADAARSAIRQERRLELALEGHRWFDLVRWGIAETVLNSYVSFEGSILSSATGTFKSINTYYPIPQGQIDISQGALKQNDGY